MKKLITILAACFNIATATAQKTSIVNYVDSLQVYFNHYSDELRSFRLAVVASNELSTLEKYEKYTQGKKNLMKEFISKRRMEFEAVPNQMFGVSHSCTKGPSGGTKECGTVCIEVPTGFIKVTGTFKAEGVGVIENENGACITLQKSGKGRIEGNATAKYEINNNYLNQLLEKEAMKLFGDITAKHKLIYFIEHYENLY